MTGIIVELQLIILTMMAPIQIVAPSYAQTYIVYVRGEQSGVERVSEIPGEGGTVTSRSEHEITVSDGLHTQQMVFETALTLKGEARTPTYCSLKYNPGLDGDYYEVWVRDGRIRRLLSRAGQKSETEGSWDSAGVIFDFNVYHHYDYIIGRYDHSVGGRQLLRAYIPVTGAELSLALTRLEDEEIDSQSGKIAIRNFRVELVGVFTGQLAVDKANRLVRLQVYDKDLVVVRQDLASSPRR